MPSPFYSEFFPGQNNSNSKIHKYLLLNYKILKYLFSVSGMSPPTRDIDPDPHLSAPNPQDQKSLQEIKHLRAEINRCLDQILKIEETAQNGK